MAKAVKNKYATNKPFPVEVCDMVRYHVGTRLKLEDFQPEDRLFDRARKRMGLNLDCHLFRSGRLNHHPELPGLSEPHGNSQRVAQVFVRRFMNPLPKGTTDELRRRDTEQLGHSLVGFKHHEGVGIQNHGASHCSLFRRGVPNS